MLMLGLAAGAGLGRDWGPLSLGKIEARSSHHLWARQGSSSPGEGGGHRFLERLGVGMTWLPGLSGKAGREKKYKIKNF